MTDDQAVPLPPGAIEAALNASLPFAYSHKQSSRDMVLAALAAAADVLRAEGAATEREAKNAAYAERDQLVAALSKRFPAHLARHDRADWEDDWRNIVCIHLPAGQATWHIHDSELPWFAHLPQLPGHWDGHSTDEKYRRLAGLLP